MKIKIIFLLLFSTSCAMMTKRTTSPSLETENQKLENTIIECEKVILKNGNKLKTCMDEYNNLLNFVVSCSQAGFKIYANKETETLSCGKPTTD